MNSKPLYLLFDFDDTLIETYDLHRRAFDITLQNIKYEGEFSYESYTGMDTLEVFQKLNFSVEESHNLTAMKRLNYENLARISPPQWVPGMFDLLNYLDEYNIKYALVTSGARTRVQQILSRLSSYDRFDFIIGREDVSFSKPHPEPYLAAIPKIGLPVRNVLVVEDSFNGFNSATLAGFGVWQITNERTERLFSPHHGNSCELKKWIHNR